MFISTDCQLNSICLQTSVYKLSSKNVNLYTRGRHASARQEIWCSFGGTVFTSCASWVLRNYKGPTCSCKQQWAEKKWERERWMVKNRMSWREHVVYMENKRVGQFQYLVSASLFWPGVAMSSSHDHDIFIAFSAVACGENPTLGTELYFLSKPL